MQTLNEKPRTQNWKQSQEHLKNLLEEWERRREEREHRTKQREKEPKRERNLQRNQTWNREDELETKLEQTLNNSFVEHSRELITASEHGEQILLPGLSFTWMLCRWRRAEQLLLQNTESQLAHWARHISQETENLQKQYSVKELENEKQKVAGAFVAGALFERDVETQEISSWYLKQLENNSNSWETATNYRIDRNRRKNSSSVTRLEERHEQLRKDQSNSILFKRREMGASPIHLGAGTNPQHNATKGTYKHVYKLTEICLVGEHRNWQLFYGPTNLMSHYQVINPHAYMTEPGTYMLNITEKEREEQLKTLLQIAVETENQRGEDPRSKLERCKKVVEKLYKVA